MSLSSPFRSFLVPISVIGLVFALAACASVPPPRPIYPQLTYRHLPSIKLNVGRIVVEDAYTPPLKAPNVEHEFPVSPADAAGRWPTDRIQTVGQSGSVKVTLREASVVEVPLKKTEGLTGVVTADQSERYEGKIVMEIEVRSEAGDKEAFISAIVKRSRTVPEDINLNDREKVFFEMTEAMMNDINAELERQIQQHLTRYLK
jgi:hypothetical protein